MKKILALILTGCTLSAFAANIESATTADNKLDTSKLECHCEKHGMIFDIKDGEKVSEMSKHCLINENKTQSMVKFLDENSNKQVKCKVNDGKLELNSCQEFNHTNKANYTHSSKMTASQYTTTSAKNN
jgi:nitrite reductase/ring-hydroxylating ferredoxin subunit